MLQAQKQRLRALYERYEHWFPVGFFVLGFLFDLLTITRIDQIDVIIQQVVYLVLVGVLITADLLAKVRPIEPWAFLRKVWPYREFAMTFALGTLLNSFTIFYFKSASGIASLLFIAILVIALTASEFKKFGESQTLFQVVLLSLSLISSFQIWVPMLLGYSGVTTFLLATLVSVGVVYAHYHYLRPRLAERPDLLRSHAIYPHAGVFGLFALLYFLRMIPPVPLSVSYLGIYHTVDKKDGQYVLGYTRPWWRFWERGDETFYARPGDAVNAYVQIFSPAGFRDKLQVRWLYQDPKRGWQSADAIPLAITGGRDEGFRAVTRKNNYQPGRWRVQVETLDEREVARYGFLIVPDESTDPREVKYDTR